MSEVGGRLQSPAYVVYVPLRFLILTVLGSIFVAFSVGQAARLFVTHGLEPISEVAVGSEETGVLPHPILIKGKKVPKTVYTSKQFNTGKSITSDSLLARKQMQSANKEWVECLDSEGGSKVCRNQYSSSSSSDDDEDESEHEPAGQHLLVDIENLDAAFLNSKERLARAMMDLVVLSGLTLLSYHCHEMKPSGVSCAGVLLESHVSFHTWPSQGVITLDLFTCGPDSLVPYVPVVEKLFCIGKTPSHEGEVVKPPHMLWSYKRRGFRNEDGYDASAGDIFNLMLGVMEFENKTEVASLKTEFQEVEIFDVIHPRFRTVEQYKRSLSNDGSYESKHPELFLPDRIVYLDGVAQSRRYGEAAYHEALVHPAMFANPNPEYVAIIGGGEGATLREVLKHDTLKQVIMIEIDKGMVDMSRKYLPEWSYCGNIAGSTESCFDDPRVKVYYQDAIQWFVDNYSVGKETHEEPALDVIIMDALDPGDNVAFSDLLFDNAAFASAMFNSLNEEGVLVAQTGISHSLEDPSSMNGRDKHQVTFKSRLQEAGFKAIREYDDSHGGFQAVWSFFVAFACPSSKARWFANEAEVNLAIRKRMRKTKEGNTPLVYFDGASMLAYHYASRAEEVVYCRTFPDAFGCKKNHGIVDPKIKEITASSFEIKESSNGDLGVFAKVDIEEGSYVALGEQTKDVFIPPGSYELIYNFTQNPVGYGHAAFSSFFNGYGCDNEYFGGRGRSLHTGALAFMNHGCNYAAGQSTADWANVVHNPFIDRNARVLSHSSGYAKRQIPAGSEISDLEQVMSTILELRGERVASDAGIESEL